MLIAKQKLNKSFDELSPAAYQILSNTSIT
jgi:hypothetical protein